MIDRSERHKILDSKQPTDGVEGGELEMEHQQQPRAVVFLAFQMISVKQKWWKRVLSGCGTL